VTEQRFRKRPVVVTAIQWTGANQADVADFLGTLRDSNPLHDGEGVGT
jgi:DNA-binding protein Fis